jgi:hypothetical protein
MHLEGRQSSVTVTSRRGRKGQRRMETIRRIDVNIPHDVEVLSRSPRPRQVRLLFQSVLWHACRGLIAG